MTLDLHVALVEREDVRRDSFTIRPPCFTGVTLASVRHETTPARSGSSVVP